MVELLKLEIEGFGKFAKKETINFKKGINFITGLNETGKSTILEAILAALFKYTPAKIQPFFCWKNKDVCKVSLTYKTDKGETFVVSSDYVNGKRKLEKITKGRTSEISTANTTISQYTKEHFGFAEQKVFENTTFIRQAQMAILGDSTSMTKVKEMIEEVLVGTAESSATKALQKIKKIKKDTEDKKEELKDDLEPLEQDFQEAEGRKEKITEDSTDYEKVIKELDLKSKKLINLKENKDLFDKKEGLEKDEKNINEQINQIDDMIETLEKDKEETEPIEQNKTLPIILIVAGVILCILAIITILGAIVGIPLIVYGIYKLLKKEEVHKKLKAVTSENVAKYQKQKKELINKKAVIETKLEKYRLVKFTIEDFKDLDRLEGDVGKLKEKEITLKTSISKTRELVKSPEEIQEEIDTIDQKMQELNEKVEEHKLAYKFLEMAETEVQHKFTPSIEKNSTPLLKEVTDNKYSNLKMNEEDLNITIKAPEIKGYVPVDVLSQGAKDQVYFTVRTVLADLLSGKINNPLILDDPFMNFDDPRLKKTINAIKKISKNKQIIFMSHRFYNKMFKNFADNLIEVK